MRIVYNCKSCHYKNKISKNASDRVELSQQIGKKFEKNCKKCYTINEYSVNDAYAEKGIENIVFLCSTLIVMAFLFQFLFKFTANNSNIQSIYLLPIGVAIPPIIYFVYIQNENKKIQTFNKFRV